jgi:predicted enzyme related to lactoylglutathione lyase
MADFAQISLGVDQAERAAAFWAGALGYTRRAPRWDGDDWIVIEPPPGAAGAAIAMDVSESRVEERPRVHLDLTAGPNGLDAEVQRLIELGASRVDWPHLAAPGEPEFAVLADPEGNRFCVAADKPTPRESSPAGPR